MSVKRRPPIPRGAPRTALPQLLTILNRQGKKPSWLMAQMGMPRQTWHNNLLAGGWPDVDIPRIAALLGVTVEQLTARVVEAPNADATVQTLLAQPELARLANDATEVVLQHMTDVVTRAVEETVRLMALGTVPMPSNATARAAEGTRRLRVLTAAKDQPATTQHRRSRR